MENKELETWLAETKAKNLTEIQIYELLDSEYNVSEQDYLALKRIFKVENQTDLSKALFNQWQKEKEFSPKIIGYKVPFDIFNGNLKKGQIIKSLNKKSNANGIELWQTENNNEGWTLPQEIVETWEAVYEPLPTEPDFKSKFEATIELIEGEIKSEEQKQKENKELKFNYQSDFHKGCALKLSSILEQIKQL